MAPAGKLMDLLSWLVLPSKIKWMIGMYQQIAKITGKRRLLQSEFTGKGYCCRVMILA